MQIRKNDREKPLHACEAQRDRLAVQLGQIGFIWHGSVLRRRLTCGRSTSKCRTDPDARHGPYAYWTTKVRGKTVSCLLTLEEADLYESWIENRRQVERILEELKKVSEKAAALILGEKARLRRSA
jgi:hypothetical protein